MAVAQVWKDWTPFGENAGLVGILVTELLGKEFTRANYDAAEWVFRATLP